MKKTISLLLVLAMVMVLSVSVFATEGVKNGETDTADVRGIYKGKDAAAPVYSVDIEWEGLTFTYTDAYDGEWNPETHKYDNVVTADWEGEGKITITNHSNAQITATPSYTAAAGYEDANMEFEADSLVLLTADNGTNGEAGNPTSGSIKVTPTGSLPEGAAEGVTIGTITVTIS